MSRLKTAKQNAINQIATHVEGIAIGDSDDYDCEFSARAAWAAKTLWFVNDDERIVSVEFSTTDIAERRGCGTETLLIYVSLSKGGETTEKVVRVPHVSWQNSSRGGRMYEARFITWLSQREQHVMPPATVA